MSEFLVCPPPDHVYRYHFATGLLRGYTGPIMDIGCGSGYGTAMLRGACLDATGYERRDDAVAICRSAGIPVIQTDWPDGVDPLDRFAVVAFEVIEHNSNGMDILRSAIDLGSDVVIGSVPYDEKPGSNDYHLLFGMTERDFAWMALRGYLRCYRPTEAPSSLLIEWRKADG